MSGSIRVPRIQEVTVDRGYIVAGCRLQTRATRLAISRRGALPNARPTNGARGNRICGVYPSPPLIEAGIVIRICHAASRVLGPGAGVEPAPTRSEAERSATEVP